MDRPAFKGLERLPPSWSNPFIGNNRGKPAAWRSDRARVIKTAVRGPNMNATAERFVGSVRRELLDHVIVLGDQHLGRLVGQYRVYFNMSRPHQGIGQRVPGEPAAAVDAARPVVARPVLGGLHHDYRRAA